MSAPLLTSTVPSLKLRSSAPMKTRCAIVFTRLTQSLLASGILFAGLVGGEEHDETETAKPKSKTAAESAEKPRRPNIVLILADDMGYECVGANGGASYRTPFLDHLAASGLRFEHCYSQPICTPSRVQLMTGIYNSRNYVRFGLLPERSVTFAQLLQRAGYATCVVGKWQLKGGADAPKHFGFDEHCLWQVTHRPGRYPNPGLETNGVKKQYSDGEYGPDLVSDFLCDFLERHAEGARSGERPILAYYPMILPHWPFEPTPDSEDWDPKAAGVLSGKGDARYFGDMVQYVDKIVRKITRKLDALDLRDDTVILFTGDNGTVKGLRSETRKGPVIGGKGVTTDAGTRVPMIVSWPEKIRAGRVSKDLVDFSDFLPTLCELAAVDVPESLQIDGRSFAPQLRGEVGKPRAWTYCWYSRNGGARGREFARTRRYKLYRGGKFYDIEQDPLEESPLADAGASDEQEAALELLAGVLQKHRRVDISTLPTE